VTLVSRHSLLMQTAYSDAKRRASEQTFVLVGSAGSVSEREVNGRRFYYRQFYDAEGKKAADYLGPVGQPQGEARARAVRDEIDLAGALHVDVRELARAGYCRVDRRTSAILAALANHELFRAGAVLVGSHAFGVLLNELGARAAAYQTEDIDVARAQPLRIALAAESSFERMLADSTVPLHPVPGFDRKTPASSYKTPGASRLRVDLLAPARGSDIGTLPVPELRAHATALPFLSYLLTDPIDAVVLGQSVVPVTVPSPERFVWHKMLVAQLRGSTREKRNKDIVQAAALFAVLAEDAPGETERAFAALPHGSKAKTRDGARQVLTLLRASGHENASEVLTAVLEA
jgi:hypothetical protein